jgi:aminoglycoside phosphotransferase (APT) family kinase protein
MVAITLPRVEIIKRCDEAEAEPQNLVFYMPYGNSVLRLSQSVAVKFGYGVTEHEARSQEKAYQILDHNIVRVPEVYDFFEDGRGRGYLVMEFMTGQVHEPITNASQLDALFRVLDHLAAQSSQSPGSLGGGPSRALLFGESDPPTFETIEQMERWFNIRHLVPGMTISFQDSKLVLCHLDLFPRNILWLPDQPPCVLDWASAGFYPRIFEACSQLIRKRLEKGGLVLDIPIPEDETERVSLILRAWQNAQRFHL